MDHSWTNLSVVPSSSDVLPHKRASTVYNQVYHLRWWEAQIGDYLLSDITAARIVECRDQLANYWYYVSSRGFIGEQWKKSLVTVLSGSDKAMATGEAPWDVSSSHATGRDVTEALAA